MTNINWANADISLDRDWTCQGTTKAGTPCRNRATNRFTPTCHAHTTPEAQAIANLLAEAYTAGHAEGQRNAESMARMKEEHAERQARRAAEAAANHRTHTPTGAQVFQAQGISGGKALTYQWAGTEPLSVGDHVWIPANWLFPTHIATVVALGSSYVGTLTATQTRATASEAAKAA